MIANVEQPIAKKLRIGISGINAGDNPGPGIGVARSLREDKGLDVEIIGLAYNAMESGLYMDWVIDRSFTMPYPSNGARMFLDQLKYVNEEAGGLDVLIPCLDAELPLMIRYASEIEAMGIKLLLPTLSQFRLRSKDRLQEVAENSQLKLPPTFVITSEAELYAVAEKVGYPLYVKGIFYEAKRAYTYSDAVLAFRKLAADWGMPIIVQGLVTGDELNLVGIGDGKGGLLGTVTAKKTNVSSLGKMWGGVTVNHPAMFEAARSFVAAHKWRGPFELECMVQGDDVYLIEINPRFPAWTYFATGVGINLPSRMIRFLLNEKFDRHSQYPAGKLFIRYSYEMVTDLEAMQRVLSTGSTGAVNITN